MKKHEKENNFKKFNKKRTIFYEKLIIYGLKNEMKKNARM